MRYSNTSKPNKPTSFTCVVFLILSWTQVFSQTDAYNNRINWQDCIEVTYWDRDYLACGRDINNHPNCRAIKFRNKCQETIYVTLYWIKSTGEKVKHGSGKFESGGGISGVGGGWWTPDAVAYEFEVGPPSESSGITFQSPKSNSYTNSTPITSENLQQQREQEAKNRKLEEQRKLQEYKAEQMRKHDAAYRSSQNQVTNGYSDQRTNQTYSQNNSYDNSAELKRKQDEAIAQQNMQKLQGAINQIKANDAAMQKFSQQMQQISNATADRIAAEMEREEEERRRNEIKEAEEKRIKEEERKQKEVITSIKQTYLNFIRTQKIEWPNSSFSTYSVLYYYTISILGDNVAFSNVFSLGRNSGTSWPYKIDVAKEIETDFDRALGKKTTEMIFVGYYLSVEDADFSKKNLQDEARSSYINAVSVRTKSSFGNINSNGISGQSGNNENDPWTGKPKLNTETIATSGTIPTPKESEKISDPWANANKSGGSNSNATTITTKQTEVKKGEANLKTNVAGDPWSKPVAIETENKEPEKINTSTKNTTTPVDATVKASTTTDPWNSTVVSKTENNEFNKKTTTNQIPNAKEVVESNKVVKDDATNLIDNTPSATTVAAPNLKKDESGALFSVVEKTAAPKGGLGAFYEYVSKNLKYPSAATRAKIEGKVYVEFIVNTDGSISDVKIAKGLGYGCDEEAIRLCKEALPWIPAQNGGLIVRQKNVYPITFKLK